MMQKSANVIARAAIRSSTLAIPLMRESPKGRSPALVTRMLSRVGMTTLAARNRVTTKSITRAKRFCSSQPRHWT